MTIKDMIVDGRLKTGHTQQSLADAVKCHVMTISQIERGTTAIPIKFVLKIARALKLDKDKFVELYLHDKMEHIKRSLK